MRRPRLSLAAAAALAIVATGCVPVYSVSGGRYVGPDDRRRVARGTTKAQLLEWFGPPLLIARVGLDAGAEPGSVAGPVALPTPAPPGTMDAEVRRGDAWFEPFAVRHPIRETHRVYHWSCSVRHGIRGLTTAWHVSTHELWVLVDEETGLAESAVFRER
ncbi:MAG TPA: hypothetical protein VFM93_12290 [Candidatus Limnocylindria bacterium]|nr:hypothetical protein [Candidatus Limnocylindria bacterium]